MMSVLLGAVRWLEAERRLTVPFGAHSVTKLIGAQICSLPGRFGLPLWHYGGWPAGMKKK